MNEIVLHERLCDASNARFKLGLAAIQSASLWASMPSGPTLARLYMNHLCDAPEGDELIEACSAAIMTLDGWAELLVECLMSVPLTTRLAHVLATVIAARKPEHPLTTFSPFDTLAIQSTYDALDDGNTVRLNVRPENAFAEYFTGILISAEHPDTTWAICSVKERLAGTIWLEVDRSAPLFAEKRIVARAA